MKAGEVPLSTIVAAAAVVALLLLLAPWTPPQLAIIGFIAISLLGVLVYVGVAFIAELLYDTADRALPEVPDEYEDSPVDDETMEAYHDGRLSEQELEDAIEDALEEEMEMES